MRSLWAMKVRTLRECIRVGFFVGAMVGLIAETVTQFNSPQAIAAQLLIKR